MSKKKQTSKKRSRPLVNPPHKVSGKPPQQFQQLPPGQIELSTAPEFQLVALLNAEYTQVMRSKENINAINAELMKRFKPKDEPVKVPEPQKPESPTDVKETITKK